MKIQGIIELELYATNLRWIYAVDESLDIDDNGACTVPSEILAVYEQAKQLQARLDREEAA